MQKAYLLVIEMDANKLNLSHDVMFPRSVLNMVEAYFLGKFSITDLGSFIFANN